MSALPQRPNEQRLTLSILLKGGSRWDPYIIGAAITGETVPSLREPSHPNGSIAAGETAIVFAHYGVTREGRGRRAPVVICRHDVVPPRRKELYAQEEALRAQTSAGGAGQSLQKKGRAKKQRSQRGEGREARKRRVEKVSILARTRQRMQQQG